MTEVVLVAETYPPFRHFMHIVFTYFVYGFCGSKFYLLQCLKDALEPLPAFACGADAQALLWRVNTEHLWADGHHIQVWIGDGAIADVIYKKIPAFSQKQP